MDIFMVKSFFWELLQLSYKDLTSWGNPCSGLLEKMCMYQKPFLDKIEGDYTNSSNEFRLNGAGLKLWWRVRRDSNGAKFECHIGGDQAKEYLMFVAQAGRLIEKYQFNRR